MNFPVGIELISLLPQEAQDEAVIQRAIDEEAERKAKAIAKAEANKVIKAIKKLLTIKPIFSLLSCRSNAASSTIKISPTFPRISRTTITPLPGASKSGFHKVNWIITPNKMSIKTLGIFVRLAIILNKKLRIITDEAAMMNKYGFMV